MRLWLGLLAGGAAYGIGCATGSEPETTPAKLREPPPEQIHRDGDERMRVEHYGSTHVGTVYFLRSLDANDPHGLLTMGPREDRVRQAGHYQKRIFDLLKDAEAAHVFVSGLDRDFVQSDPEYRKELIYWILEDSLAVSRDRDALHDVGMKVGAVRSVLGLIGGGLMYGLTYPSSVTLHATLTPDQKQSIESGEDTARRNSDQRHIGFMKHWKENHVAREIMAFLQENPGSDVYLVMGALHGICDNFIALKQYYAHTATPGLPLIKSVWWDSPELRTQIPKLAYLEKRLEPACTR